MCYRITVLCAALAVAGSSRAAEGMTACADQAVQHDSLTYFVAVSAAALRDEPAISSTLRAHLPMATALGVACERGGWLRVWAPSYKGLVAWVRRDMVDKDEPTLKRAPAQLAAAPRRNRALISQHAERVLALGATDEEALAVVIRALASVGDHRGAARVRAQLAAVASPVVKRARGGPNMIFVANGQLISPLAVLDHGRLVSFEGVESRKYFRPGRTYYFYARSGADGLARVQRKAIQRHAELVRRFNLADQAGGST